jgi:hypothetical protein
MLYLVKISVKNVVSIIRGGILKNFGARIIFNLNAFGEKIVS